LWVTAALQKYNNKRAEECVGKKPRSTGCLCGSAPSALPTLQELSSKSGREREREGEGEGGREGERGRGREGGREGEREREREREREGEGGREGGREREREREIFLIFEKHFIYISLTITFL